MILPRLVLVALLGLAAPLGAQTAPDQPQSQAPVDRLGEVMQLDALFAVLREEGLAYGETLQADMFPAGGGAEWKQAVSDIYDLARLRDGFDAALKDALVSDA